MTRDFIPRPNNDFNTFQRNLVKSVVDNAVAWSIPAGEVNDLTVASAQYGNLYKIIANKNERTKVQVSAYNSFRKSYEKDLRKFANHFLRDNKNISAGDMSNMNIKVRGKKRQKRAHIDTAPELVVVCIPGAYLRILCRREGHIGRASLHPESDGVELRYSIGTATNDFNQLQNTLFSKKAHIRLPVETDWRGKNIYICVRWANLADHTRSSAWSEVMVQMVY